MGILARKPAAYAAYAFWVNLPWLFFLRIFILSWGGERFFEFYLADRRQDCESQHGQQEQDKKNKCDHHGHIQAVRHLLALHSLSCGCSNIRTHA